MNRESNEVSILRLDRPYTLKLTNSVLKRFCAAHKIGIQDLETVLNHYDKMLDLVYFMVLRESPNMTQKEFDALIDDVPIMDVVNACAEAFTVAFNTGETEVETGSDPT